MREWRPKSHISLKKTILICRLTIFQNRTDRLLVLVSANCRLELFHQFYINLKPILLKMHKNGHATRWYFDRLTLLSSGSQLPTTSERHKRQQRGSLIQLTCRSRATSLARESVDLAAHYPIAYHHSFGGDCEKGGREKWRTPTASVVCALHFLHFHRTSHIVVYQCFNSGLSLSLSLSLSFRCRDDFIAEKMLLFVQRLYGQIMF